MRVLCLASEILGNQTFSAHLLDALKEVPGIELDVVRLNPDDHDRYGSPGWTRFSDPFRTRAVLRRKLSSHRVEDYDALFLEFWEAALVLPEWNRALPTALAMDLLPTLAAELSLRRTESSIRRRVKAGTWRLYHRAFASVVPHVDVFAPICHWVADALERDYGVRANRSNVTYVPLDLERWRPAPRARGTRARLFFAGNDFRRRGGELLLAAYRLKLTDVATLVIASNDDCFDRLTLPEGVSVLRGLSRDELLPEYQQSDLFVFPTRADILPNSLAEALATGLPCIATDVGGIADLVRPGESGELVDYSAGAEEWGERVRDMLGDRERMERLRAGARRVAEADLGLARFGRVVNETVEQLCLGKRNPAASLFRSPVNPSSRGSEREAAADELRQVTP